MLYSDSLNSLSLVEKTRVDYTGIYHIYFDRTQGRSPIEFHLKREELEDLYNKIFKVLEESREANIANLERVERDKQKWMSKQ